MGRYDAERKSMGFSSTGSNSSSRYSAERKAIMNPPSSTADWRKQEDTNTMPDIPAPVVEEQSTWDKVKAFDIKGLTGGNSDSNTTQNSSMADFRRIESSPSSIPDSKSSTWDQIKAGDIKGIGSKIGVGLAHGLSETGTEKMDRYMANSFADKEGPLQTYFKGQQVNQQKQEEWLKANPADSLPAMLGEQIPQLPLWIAGEGAVRLAGKGIAKLSPRLASTAEKVGSKVPSFIKGGLTDVATFGTVVAPTENIRQGGSFQDLLDKEKQLPTIALGGAVARGAFSGIGKGISGTKAALKPLGVPPELVGPPRPPEPITIPEQQTLMGALKSGEGQTSPIPNNITQQADKLNSKVMPSPKYSVGNEVLLQDGRKGVITRNTSSIASLDYMPMLTVKLEGGKEIKVNRNYADDISSLNAPLKKPTGEIPNLGNPKIKLPLPKDEKVFWQSVNKELFSKGEQPPFTVEIMKKDIQSGKLDISKLANEEEIRTMLGMDLQKFSNGQNKINTPITNQQSIDNILPEPANKIIIGKQKEKTNFTEALKKFYTRVVNTQQTTFDVGKVSGSDIGKLASNTKNISGIVDHNFLTAMVDKNGNKVGESLKSTIETIPKGQDEEFWTYMTQRHNIDRAREGKPLQHYETTVDGVKGKVPFTPEQSTLSVKQIEQTRPEYKVVGDNITGWLDDFMKTWGIDTGIVDKDIYAGLRETYKSYFPTQRDFSELEKSIPDGLTAKFADQNTPIRKATGSERDIKDPTENIMNLVSKVVRTAKYNEVGQALLNDVKSSPEKMKQFAEVIPVKDGMFANTDNVISVLVDGKAQYLKINYKPLLDAMNGLPKSIGHIPVLDTLTTGFKSLITQKNPFFALRNIFRDIPTAYVYGSEANPIKFGAGLLGAGKDILTNGPRLQKYQAVGGGGANFFSPGDVTKSVAELTGKINPIKKIIKAPIKAIEKFNNLTETAPRLAEFNRVLKKTGDTNKALFAANDVTVNFSRGGNITKGVDKVAPYLNAGVQGIDKFVRGFINPKTAISTIVKSGVAITTPDLALYLVNKDNPDYQALDNRTKDSYFLIPQDNGTFIKIPKSRELGVLFGSLFERISRANEGQKDSFKGFSNTVATNFSPANPIDSNFFAPVIHNIPTNKDFANRAIVPQGMKMDKRSPYLQFDDRSTSTAKWFADLIKDVPMPQTVKDKIGSPKIIDYLVKSYSGVVGQFGTPLLVPGGSPKKALTSQFIADPKFSSQDTTDFYDKLDKLSSAATDKNINEKIPSKKLTPEEDMRNSMNGISSALSRGTKLISSIQSSSDPNKEAKIRAIKTQMLDLSGKAVDANTPKLMQSVENSSKKLFNK